MNTLEWIVTGLITLAGLYGGLAALGVWRWSEARGGLIGGKTVMMPWEGQFRDFRRRAGMMIPFYGEVAWITP